MSKRDELMKGLGNVRESMGDFESAGAPRTTPAAGPRTTPAHLVGVVRSKDVSQIAIDRIERDPTQPREDFDADALERLAQSLKTRGLLQPLRVRWDAGLDRYVILCGERRWRAARMAGLESLACVIIEGDLSPQERLAVQLVENALREDLRPIEQAKAYKTLMDDQVWTVRQLAAELAIHHGQVVRAMALLELPAPVRDQVEQGSLAPATAYEISKVEDEDTRQRLAQRVIAEGLSRDETIAEVRAASERRTGKAKGRGAAGTRRKLPTTRTMKAAGCRITVEHRKGLDDELLVQALREAADQIEVRRQEAA